MEQGFEMTTRELKFIYTVIKPDSVQHSEPFKITAIENKAARQWLDKEVKYNKYYHKLYRRQYIGIPDANGKEIYEGHIVSVEVEEVDLVTVKDNLIPGVVVFANNTFGVIIKGDEQDAFVEIDKDCIIIGDFYENPNLIS